MSDSYSAWCEEQAAEGARKREEKKVKHRRAISAKKKKCEADIRRSGLKCVKCCGTCATYFSGSCSKLCVGSLGELHICRFWKLNDDLDMSKCCEVDDDLVFNAVVDD